MGVPVLGRHWGWSHNMGLAGRGGVYRGAYYGDVYDSPCSRSWPSTTYYNHPTTILGNRCRIWETGINNMYLLNIIVSD